MYFIQPLYSKTCRSFTFPSAAGSMWCTVGYFYIYTRYATLSRRRRRRRQQQQQQQLLFRFPFHPVSVGHLHTVALGRDGAQPSSTLHLLLLLSLSAPPSPTLLLLLSSLFLSSPMTPRILLAPSPSTSTLQTSFRLISFTYSSHSLPHHALHSSPAPFGLRPRDTPSTVSSLRSFVTTQRAHLIRIIRAISVFPTRPPRFFVVAPPRARVLSKAQQAPGAAVYENEISEDNIFLRTANEEFNDAFFPLLLALSVPTILHENLKLKSIIVFEA